MNYYPGIEQDALDYVEMQKRQKDLVDELQHKDPSLLNRMMKAGLLALLGAIGANIMDQDPSKGAAAGMAAGFLIPPRKQPITLQPSYRFMKTGGEEVRRGSNAAIGSLFKTQVSAQGDSTATKTLRSGKSVTINKPSGGVWTKRTTTSAALGSMRSPAREMDPVMGTKTFKNIKSKTKNG